VGSPLQHQYIVAVSEAFLGQQAPVAEQESAQRLQAAVATVAVKQDVARTRVQAELDQFIATVKAAKGLGAYERLAVEFVDPTNPHGNEDRVTLAKELERIRVNEEKRRMASPGG
jgi:hypothetical protein